MTTSLPKRLIRLEMQLPEKIVMMPMETIPLAKHVHGNAQETKSGTNACHRTCHGESAVGSYCISSVIRSQWHRKGLPTYPTS